MMATATTVRAEELLNSNLNLMQATLPLTAAQIDEATPLAHLAAGSWSFQTYGSVTFGEDSGELYLAHAGFGYHPWDNISINAEMVGGVVSAEDEGGESGTVGGDLLVRYHFLRGDGWSLYGEAGSGFLQTSMSFPANGTHFNFTPQAGIGLLMDLDDNMHLMAGARWHHVSNARMQGVGQNPGYDAAMIYAGVLLRF